MPTPQNDQLPTITHAELANVAGGFDIGQIAGSIGGLVDQFAGTGGKATQIANQIGGLVGSFMGGGQGGAQGAGG